MALVDFIKSQRLKKAALILRKGKISIAEVSYMVGFSDPKYFSKCFIKEFGKTPTEYSKDFQEDMKWVVLFFVKSKNFTPNSTKNYACRKEYIRNIAH